MRNKKLLKMLFTVKICLHCNHVMGYYHQMCKSKIHLRVESIHIASHYRINCIRQTQEQISPDVAVVYDVTIICYEAYMSKV